MLSDAQIVEQIQEALEELRPYFYMHGGNIVFDSFKEGTVYVRLHGACEGCPASSYTLKLMVEESLKKEVPQVERVEELED
jgi:Fe-S cluster biogenesis protein NfuA